MWGGSGYVRVGTVHQLYCRWIPEFSIANTSSRRLTGSWGRFIHRPGRSRGSGLQITRLWKCVVTNYLSQWRVVSPAKKLQYRRQLLSCPRPLICVRNFWSRCATWGRRRILDDCNRLNGRSKTASTTTSITTVTSTTTTTTDNNIKENVEYQHRIWTCKFWKDVLTWT
jgi:hypothetical protein